MVRGAAGLSVAWLGSCVPLALPNVWPPAVPLLEHASATALAALPWIAWIGLPLRSPSESLPLEPARAAPGEPRSAPENVLAGQAWPCVLLAAPPIALGLAVDLGRGGALSRVALEATSALAMIALLLAAAVRAQRGRRSALVYALAWLALVPGLPFLSAVLELGGAPVHGSAGHGALHRDGAARWLTLGADASPLAWAWLSARDLGASPLPWAALGVCLALCAIGELRGPLGESRKEGQR